jgi:hypothetical protein
MKLIAKPIIKNQYWLVTDGNKKIGNVTADSNGFEVKLGTSTERYTTTNAIQKGKNISFVKIEKNKDSEPPFAVFPTNKNRVYNSVFDVRRKLHLYTETPKSKCYHAAGWFAVKLTTEYVEIFCPKYIFIQRYPYLGPFKSQDEVKNIINTL